MNQQWLSIVEYARFYKLSDMTVRRRIKTGRLTAVLKDGKYFIPVTEDGGNQEEAPKAPLQAPASPQNPMLTAAEKPIYMPIERTFEPKVRHDEKVEEVMTLCEDSAKRFDELQSTLRQTFEVKKAVLDNKISSLEEQLARKSLQLKHTERENEDLKLLLEILQEQLSPEKPSA